jgi:hypothetical protein
MRSLKKVIKNPYTNSEKIIMNHLIRAFNKFRKLQTTHPSHELDFTNGIHMCQNVIIHKIVQRDYPNVFSTYKKK